eukprot:2032642-Amphidinium_carterae.1
MELSQEVEHMLENYDDVDSPGSTGDDQTELEDSSMRDANEEPPKEDPAPGARCHRRAHRRPKAHPSRPRAGCRPAWLDQRIHPGATRHRHHGKLSSTKCQSQNTARSLAWTGQPLATSASATEHSIATLRHDLPLELGPPARLSCVHFLPCNSKIELGVHRTGAGLIGQIMSWTSACLAGTMPAPTVDHWEKVWWDAWPPVASPGVLTQLTGPQLQEISFIMQERAARCNLR